MAGRYLIYGSTGGIGSALCARLAERGAELHLVGRDQGKVVGATLTGQREAVFYEEEGFRIVAAARNGREVEIVSKLRVDGREIVGEN